MDKKKGQIAAGWIISGGIFVVGIIYTAGGIVQRVQGMQSIQDAHTAEMQKLIDNEANIVNILSRQDERIKFLESKK